MQKTTNQQLKKKKNLTVDLTKQLEIYYQERNHHHEKKHQFFGKKLENEYYIDTYNLDDTL